MKSNKKINVGVFSDVYYPMIDGVVKVLENHVKYLNDKVNFYLIVPKVDKNYEEKSIGEKEIIRTKSVKIFFLDYKMPIPKLDCGLKPKLKNIKFDFIIAHSPFGIGKYGLKWAKKHNIPSLIFAHSQLKQDFKRAAKLNSLTNLMLRYVMKIYQLATKVIAVGEGIKHVYLNDYKLKNDVVVINNATNFKLLDDQQFLKKLKARHNILDDEMVFIFVGRINILKGIYLIADALKIVKDNDIKFKMIAIGAGNDLKDYKEYVKSLGLEKNFIFTGLISDSKEVAGYLNISDLFLFPSLYDASSIVQNEAASQKTPVLFSEGSTTSYGLEDGVQCFKANHNAQDYANKIIEIYQNPRLLENMKETVYEKLYRTWEASANQLYDLMIEMINHKKK